MRRGAFRIVAVLVLASAAALLVVATGIVPIAASSGHWPITERLLRFAMRRSIATHSLTLSAPVLDDPILVLQGAALYDAACAGCHGSPEQPHVVLAEAMVPPARYLGEGLAEWSAEELFYVVKHGVKFTGMPAWPAQQRDDEVWAMVAFLRTLPGIDAAEYRKLARDEGTVGPRVEPFTNPEVSESAVVVLRASCVGCHAADGLGRGGAFPVLAGQSPGFLRNALRAYAAGERHSGIMESIAAGLEAGTIDELAAYFADLPGPTAPGDRAAQASDEAAIARGREIAHSGISAQRVPSCVECHGPGPERRNPAYPRHAGQSARYIIQQLELFQSDLRGGSSYAHLMRPIAQRLDAGQIRDVAAYYASLQGAQQASGR
jgi:cytochrome c553